MPTDTVEVARGDLRTLVLAAGYVLGRLDALPEDADERDPCDDALIVDMVDAGLVVDNDAADCIEWPQFSGVLKRTRAMVLDDPEPELGPAAARAVPLASAEAAAAVASLAASLPDP